ncbi:MAG: PD-(D/E)XK nuclease family protein [Solirubrobacterales bacterium]|nr:PD-(D/E)XK nuclease family protein [Solirubrobacterales bacterium]
MSLTLVIGPANSAKAGEVLGAYRAAARRDAVLVVPTVADAHHYDRELAGDGVSFGRALTFDALISEIAERLGYQRPRVSALRRRLLLRRVLQDLEFEHLTESAMTPGFSVAATRLVADLRAQRVTPQRLTQAVQSDDAYMRDLAALYRRYCAALEDSEDSESYIWGALDALRADPGRWRDSAVFFYGFDDLTAPQSDAVETLSKLVPVTVSLTYERGRQALAARATAVEELRPLAAEVREHPALDTFYAKPALHHLERHLFEPDVPRVDPGGAVQILEAGGELAEAELVAAEVRTALNQGVPAGELVVVCRSLTRQGALLERTLARYGVPVTSARRVPFTHTALGRGVRAFVEGEKLAYLRLTRDRHWVDQLEARIRRSGSDAELSQIQLPPDLEAAVTELLPKGGELDLRAAATLRAALAEVGEVNQEETRALLDELEVGAHPDGPGGVLVAEPLAIRARRFRRVFITGLCENEFPTGESPDPFLSEQRRRELALGAGLVLAPPADQAAQERYLLYASVSRAEEQVVFSYTSSDEDGNQITPSPFLAEVAALFSELPRRRRLLADVLWTESDAPTERERALAAAGAILNTPPPKDAATARLGPAALAHVRHTTRVSPGALENFAACPVGWLVDRQLQPGELEPEAAPLAKGTLMHEALRRIVAGEPDVLETLELPAELAPGRPPAVRQAILDGIVAELARYLDFEREHPTPGFKPFRLEEDFEVELDAGLHVNGVIDRLDTDASGRAIVRDYKSGADKLERSAKNWVEAQNFQVALYMLAARRKLDLVPVAGVYQPLGGPDLRPRGAVQAELELPVRAGDRLAADELEELLLAVEAEANALAATLQAGELTPCPATCSRDGCRHPGICWATR